MILAFPGDVRSELVCKARQENKDQGSSSPSSWDIAREALKASPWGIAREALEAAIASGRQTSLKYGSGLNVRLDNLKSGAAPDLIELSKRRAARVWQEQ